MLKRLLFVGFLLLSFNVNAGNIARDSYADIVAPLIPAVVNISITQKAADAAQLSDDNPYFEEFRKFFEHFGQMPNGPDFDEEGHKATSAGSGFIISADGLIVTNHHVIDNAEKITVTLSNNQKFEAKIIGSDNRTDIALLKIDSKSPLAFVEFGNSDNSRVGDFVITIGNPFGLGSTVTSGIISAQARDISADSANIIDNFIQTDASINRGNSGGPMFNMKGEVIGINFAIFSPTGGSVGVGFALPSSAAKPIVEQLRKTGKVIHGWLGVMIQPTSDTAEGLGLNESIGAIVAGVSKNSPAEKAGLKVGDIILSFDGKEVTAHKKLPRIVAETPVGKTVVAEIMSGGTKKSVKITVGTQDSKNDLSNITSDEAKQIYGMSLSPITPDVRKKLNLPNDMNGILVNNVDRKSVAAKVGIKRGDIINSANQQTMVAVDNLFTVIEKAKKMKRKSVMLLIYRSGSVAFLNLPIK